MTVKIQDMNHSGMTGDITFYPITGGSINLGSQLIPYYYTAPLVYGDYSVYFSGTEQTCTTSLLTDSLIVIGNSTVYGLVTFSISDEINNFNFEAYVDWGDGSPIEAYTGNYNYNFVHNYAVDGNYTVIVTFNDNTIPNYFEVDDEPSVETVINFPVLPNLTEIYIYANNDLLSLDLRDCTNLQTVNLDSCEFLSSVLFGNNPSLNFIYVPDTIITDLDVSSLNNLVQLDCSQSQVINLNVSGCTNLGELYCQNNQITGLDLLNCSNLNLLFCNENQLTYLNVSGLTNLNTIDCYINQLTTLNLSGCTLLQSLDCSTNQLNSLYVSSDSALLSDLYCNDNQLTDLNLSGFTSLSTLYCDTNQLTNLNISGCTSLVGLYTGNNQLTSLYLDSFNIFDIRCSFNYLPITIINQILVHLNSETTNYGQADLDGQTPPAPPSGAGITAKTNLQTVKFWTVNTD